MKELAEEFTKDLKDEGKVVKEFKVVVLEPMKKEGKKEPEGKKRKNNYQKTYLYIFILIKNGLKKNL